MNEIRQLIPKLSDNLNFPRAKENKVTGYINNLENRCVSFNNTREKLNKAENYYIELEKNIENLIRSIRGWITKRKEERKMCLGTFKGRIKPYDPSSLQNPFENMNDQAGNNYNTKDYYSPNPNQANINNNIFPQNNNNQNQNDDHLDQPYCSSKLNK